MILMQMDPRCWAKTTKIDKITFFLFKYTKRHQIQLNQSSS